MTGSFLIVIVSVPPPSKPVRLIPETVQSPLSWVISWSPVKVRLQAGVVPPLVENVMLSGQTFPAP